MSNIRIDDDIFKLIKASKNPKNELWELCLALESNENPGGNAVIDMAFDREKKRKTESERKKEYRKSVGHSEDILWTFRGQSQGQSLGHSAGHSEDIPWTSQKSDELYSNSNNSLQRKRKKEPKKDKEKTIYNNNIIDSNDSNDNNTTGNALLNDDNSIERFPLNLSLSHSLSPSPLVSGGNKFTKPTIDEIAEYVKSKGYHVDATNFYYFYDSKGWMVGKTKMKNWKSCIATWEHRWKQENGVSEDQKEEEDDGYCR